MTRKLRVGVLFGGQSGEHEVSLVSARAIIEGLDHDKYEVVPIGITKQGHWLVGNDSLAALEAMADARLLPGGAQTIKKTDVSTPDPMVIQEAPSPMTLLPTSQVETPSGYNPPLDVVFPVLHGPRGEDGTV